MNVSGNHEGELLGQFANKYDLHVKHDECGDPVIGGKRGHLYEYGPTELGLMFLPPGDDPSPRLWNTVLSKCLAAGMILRQRGDSEGVLSFDPLNKEQARLAIKLSGVRPKKQISEVHKEKLLAGLRKYHTSRSEAAQSFEEGVL